MADIFDQVADSQAAVSPQPQQAARVQTQPQSQTKPVASGTSASGDIFDQVANQSATPTQTQDTSSTDYADAAFKRSQDYKRKAWAQTWQDLKNFRMHDAANDVASLFHNPDEQMDLTTGMLKGAGQSVNAVSSALNKIPVVGETLAPSSGIKAAEQMETPTSTGQKIGVGIETLAEFMMGEAGIKALEGLNYTQKLSKVLPYMRQLEENDHLRKIVTAAYNTAKFAGLSAASSAIHAPTGQRWDEAKTGAEYGAAGAVTGELLGAGARALLPRTTAVTSAEAAKTLEEAASERRTAAKAVTDISAKASEAATGVKSNASTFQEAANEIKAHFDPVYDELREASGGVFNNETGRYGANGFDDAVNQIKRAKKVIYSSAPASTDALKTAEAELAEGQEKLQTLFGSDTEKYATAQAAWRKASTLEDLHESLDKAFTEPAGVRRLGTVAQYDASGNVIKQGATPSGEIDPKKFIARANGAIDKLGPELRNALGDGFYDLETVRRELSVAAENKDYARTLEQLTRKELQKAGVSSPVSKTFGGPAFGVSAGTAAHFILGASNPVTGTIGLTAGTLHWMYTHPDQAVRILRVAKSVAPLASQAAKQGANYVFHPEAGLMPTESSEQAQQ
jgi:hypothetical protein